MNKTIIITAIITFVITALVVFIAMAGMSVYQGKSASDWYEQAQNTESFRAANWNAITCIRGLGYTNFPNIEDSYDISGINSIDSAGNYYSKGQVDECLYGL